MRAWCGWLAATQAVGAEVLPAASSRRKATQEQAWLSSLACSRISSAGCLTSAACAATHAWHPLPQDRSKALDEAAASMASLGLDDKEQVGGRAVDGMRERAGLGEWAHKPALPEPDSESE